MNNARTVASLNGLDPEQEANKHDQSLDILNRQLAFAKQKSVVNARSGDLQATLASFKDVDRILDEIANKTQKIPILGTGHTGRYGRFTGQYQEKFVQDTSTSERAATAEYQRQAAILQQIQQRKQAEVELGRQQLEVNKRLVETMSDLAKKIGNFNPFDSKGKLKDQYAGAADALKELIGLQEKFNQAVAGLGGTGRGNVEAVKTLQEQIVRVKTAFGQQQASVMGETITERQQNDVTKAQQGIANATELGNRALEKSTAAARKAREAYNDAFSAFNKGFQQAKKYEESASSIAGAFMSGRSIARRNPNPAILDRLGASVQSGNFDYAHKQLDEYHNSLQRMDALRSEMRAPIGNQPGANGSQLINEMRNSLDVLQKARGAKETAQDSMNNISGSLKTVTASVKELETEFGPLKAASENFGIAATKNAQEVANAVDSLTGKVNRNIAAFERMNTLARESQSAVETAGQAPTVSHKRLGGPMIYAAGGFMADFMAGNYARGTDNIPVMMGRDEAIMNAMATKKFFPQIMAMNRGIDPTRGAVKPSVTHVGGIHVTVNGGSTAKSTTNEIVGGLNRAIRRGSVKLGG